MRKIIILFLLIIFSTWTSLFGTSYNTIVIDGTNDFASDEDISGTSSSVWYYTWDANNLYIGLNATDVSSGNGNIWIVLYIDTDPQSTPTNGSGSTTGITYNTQQPSLPFSANYHFRWKADDSFQSLESYTTSWNNTTWSGSVTRSGQYVEFSIPRTNIGSPSQIHITGSMINETGFAESTFFMSPSGQSEGYDVNYTKWFGFELTTGVSPDASANVDNALPVELTSFSALAQSNAVNLTWETATEVNNYGFEILRSAQNDKADWTKVGFVEGHGNSNSAKQYSYVDNSVRAGQSYSYRLKQIDFDGQFEYSNVVNVEVGVPMEFSLAQNYPNPFNPSTSIEYTVPSNEYVTLKVYDVLGNTVSTIVNENKEAGKYNVTFDASNITSGIYFYSIQAGKFNQVKKMMLVK